MKLRFAAFLLLVSFILFTLTAVMMRERLISRTVEVPSLILVDGTIPGTSQPKTLVIDSIGVSLTVIPAQKNAKGWEMTSKGISYLAETPKPGEPGNAVIYGHNWPNLLGKLPKVKTGDEILVIFENDAARTFKVDSIKVVLPDNAELLAQTPEPRLTVYTCTGLFDTKRFVVTASLKDQGVAI